MVKFGEKNYENNRKITMVNSLTTSPKVSVWVDNPEDMRKS